MSASHVPDLSSSPCFISYFSQAPLEKRVVVWRHGRLQVYFVRVYIYYFVSLSWVASMHVCQTLSRSERLLATVPITHRVSPSAGSIYSTVSQTTEMNHERCSRAMTRRGENMSGRGSGRRSWSREMTGRRGPSAWSCSDSSLAVGTTAGRFRKAPGDHGGASRRDHLLRLL